MTIKNILNLINESGKSMIFYCAFLEKKFVIISMQILADPIKTMQHLRFLMRRYEILNLLHSLECVINLIAEKHKLSEKVACLKICLTWFKLIHKFCKKIPQGIFNHFFNLNDFNEKYESE